MRETDIALVNQPTPNMGLLDSIIDHIEAHPEQWNQKTWARETTCGTAYCVAGFACAWEEGSIVKGGYLFLPKGSHHAMAVLGDDYDNDYDWLNGDYGVPMSHAWIPFHEAGQSILGLTNGEAERLFMATNTLDDIKVQVEAIRYRAREQERAFERIGRELIDSLPELEVMVKAGSSLMCPESREVILKAIKGFTETQ